MGWESHARPAVTVDNVVFARKNEGYALLLIKRRNEPFALNWALPGGFIFEHEPPIDAAKRKLNSEANLSDIPLIPLGVFGDANRDPRGWFITIAYFALVNQNAVKPYAGDDASDAIWFDFFWERENDLISFSLTHDNDVLHSLVKENLETVPYGMYKYYEIIENSGLAFDHAKIIATAVSNLECVTSL